MFSAANVTLHPLSQAIEEHWKVQSGDNSSTVAHRCTIFHLKIHFAKKIGPKQPFQLSLSLSAVVRPIYRRLYGVPATNQMTEIQMTNHLVGN